MISSSWVFVACISCSDWTKLWLLVIPLRILPMFSWYRFSFSMCFILAFCLLKSSFLVIVEYALLTRREQHLQLVWWWELWCRYWSLFVDFIYTNKEISSLFCFNKVSRSTSSPLLSSSIVNYIFWWRLLIWRRSFPSAYV